MTVLVPPPRVQFWFRAVGRRVDPEYRPWVAEQINDPRFRRKRLGPSLVIFFGLIFVPQTLFALVDHSTFRLIPPAVLLVALAVSALVTRNRQMPASTRQRLLAYHGVTADGQAVQPISAWAANPLGKTGLALLTAQVLIFSSGVAVAADRIVAQQACHRVPADQMAALAAAVGQPVPAAAAAFGAPAPIVPAGSRLLYPREADGSFGGLRYAAAYVRSPDGRLLGPAVWRLDDLNMLIPVGSHTISAQDRLARTITPTLGYSFAERGTAPADPAIRTAADCAQAAR